MILEQTKTFTKISVMKGCIVTICNKSKGTFLFPGNAQLQIEDEDGFDQYVDLSDEQIDEIILALQKAKTNV